METESLYERIGGKAALDAAVDIFYTKLLADDRVNEFFGGVDMPGQRGKQKMFLAMALGGPVNFTGRDLTDMHFDAVAENFVATLEELGVPQDMIGEVVAIVGPTRDAVLGRSAGGQSSKAA
ncbi:MAG: hemoglobin [Phycisphaerales bacterium]|jgi:hemoglobin